MLPPATMRAFLIDKQEHYGIRMDGSALAAAYRSGGPEAYWRARLEQMRGANAPLFANFAFATIHAHLGEFDRAVEYLEKIDRLGGAVKAIVHGYYQGEIHKSALDYQRAVEAGTEVIGREREEAFSRERSNESD